MLHKLTAYMTALAIFCLTLAPVAVGAGSLARKKKPKCATGKHAVRKTKRVRVTVRVRGKHKRVWVKRRVWVCAKNAIKPIPAPDPPKPVIVPLVTPAPVPAIPDTTPPAAPPSFRATPGNTQVALSWGASTDNVKTVYYQLFRDGVPISAQEGLTFTDTGLTNGTAYVYTLVAHDSSDNTSDVSRVTSTPVDSGAPTVPGGLTAVPGNAQVSLSWTASTDNVAVTGYNVYRSGGGAASTLITPTPITTLYHLDTGRMNGTAYSYTVAAVDGSGNVSAQSGAVSATPNVPSGDAIAPSTPTGLTATGGTSQASLSWTASTDNVGVTGYKVYRATSAAGPFTTALPTQPAGPSFVDTGLTNGTIYYYKVSALDASNNESPLSAVASVTPGDTTAPTTPSNVTITKNSSAHTLTIAWAASSDNIGVTGYRLTRSTNGGAYSQVATPAGTSYTDASLSQGKTYAYRVSAVDAAGNASLESPAVSTFVS